MSLRFTQLTQLRKKLEPVVLDPQPAIPGQSLQWTGQWKSSYYWFVHGRATITLPQILNEQTLTDYQTHMEMDYQGIMYRYGQRLIFPLLAKWNGTLSKLVMHGSLSTPGVQVMDLIEMEPGMNGSQILQTQPEAQDLTFTISNVAPNRISGFYTSTNPADQGTFWLTPPQELRYVSNWTEWIKNKIGFSL